MAMSRGEVESAVGRELTGDERLLWSGQPRQVAVLATGVGFVCGWLLTVVGLGVW
ncbi:MAG: hypothetical protein WEG40_14385 [Candidatus Rokuibacteriota bacterium]